MPFGVDSQISSSPDPLNPFPLYSSPSKHVVKTRRSLPLQGGSPTKQTFELDVGNQLSPQKIRVTVEAGNSNLDMLDGQSGEANVLRSSPYYVPTMRPNERTRTTTIPVKGLSDSEDEESDGFFQTPTKRRRGRPRKSVETPIPVKTKNRIITPAANNSARRRTVGDLVDGDDENDWDFVIGAGVEVGRGKGRSRSRSLKSISRSKDTPVTRSESSPGNYLSSTTSKRGRGRRKTLVPDEVQILEDMVDEPPLEPEMQEQVHKEDTTLSVIDVNAVRQPRTTTFSSTGDDEGNSYQRHVPISTTALRPQGSLSGSSKIQYDESPVEYGKASISPATEFLAEKLEDASSSKEAQDGQQQSAVEEACGDDQNSDPEDRMDHLAELDTILESEGFSMISVDSVPSLRDRFSSPAGNSSPAKPISVVNKSLLSVPVHTAEDSFSSIAPEILEAATPRRIPANPALLAVKRRVAAELDDSFSSIPPDVLEAATPKRILPKNRLSALRASAFPKRDDSFSSIPSEILEAATPARQRHVRSGFDEPLPVKIDSTAANTLVHPAEHLIQPKRPHRDSSRLLTPEETPSPPTESILSQSNKDLQNVLYAAETTRQMSEDTSSFVSNMQSSPPPSLQQISSHTSALQKDYPPLSAMTETPSVMFSSPSLPPLKSWPSVVVRPHNRGAIDGAKNRSISSVVRAGRALQDITVPLSSSDCSANLRSPFNSPVALRKPTAVDEGQIMHNQSSLDVSRQGETPHTQKKKDFVDVSKAVEIESRNRVIVEKNAAQAHDRRDSGTDHNDPFRDHVAHQLRSASLGGMQDVSLDLSSLNATDKSALDQHLNAKEDTMSSTDDMSWQTEYHPPQKIPLNDLSDSSNQFPGNNLNVLEAGITKASSFVDTEVQDLRETLWAQERALVSKEIEAASTSQVILIGSDDSFAGDVGVRGREEPQADVFDHEDIWQAEARHSSSLAEEVSRNNSFDEITFEKPRQRNVPASGRQHGRNPKAIPAPAVVDCRPIEPLKRLLNHKPPKTVPLEALPLDEDMADLSIMWHIPQKSHFTPRPLSHRQTEPLDLSALLGSSPQKPSTDFSKTSKFPSGTQHSLGGSNGKLPVGEISHDVRPASRLGNHALNESVSEKSDMALPDVDGSQLDDRESSSSPAKSRGSSRMDENTELSPQRPIPLLTPRKSCVRNSSIPSPTKTVIFAAENPSPLSPPPRLSCTTWSKAHWKLLSAIYQDSKPSSISVPTQAHTPTPESTISDDSSAQESSASIQLANDMKQALRSPYLGRTISAQGSSLTLEVWHLQIVALFGDQVPGWDEGVVAKRLFAIIVGEERRRKKLVN